jgi:universal stress protein A
MTTITRILVPTDFSETADAALAYAKGLAVRLGASVHLMHVFDDIFATSAYAPEVYAPLPDDVRERTLRGIEAQLDERLPVPVRLRLNGTTEIRTGLTATAIVECAKERDIDLIVMGTHGRGGVAHLLLGSVAERVVRVAPCPVLTVCAARASRDRASSREEPHRVAVA